MNKYFKLSLLTFSVAFATNVFAATPVDPQYTLAKQNGVFNKASITALATASIVDINAKLAEIQSAWTEKMSVSDGRITSALDVLSEDISNAIMAYGQSQIMLDGALSNYETAQQAKIENVKVVKELEQPITNCMQFAIGKNLSGNIKNLRKQTVERVTNKVTDALDKTNTMTSDQVYLNNKNLYATETSKIPNGDINAALMFGGYDGALTRYTAEEEEATGAFIENIVGMQNLPIKASGSQLLSANGQRYENLRQRFVTHLSAAETSMWNVANFYKAQPELLSFFTQAQLTPNKVAETHGVSVNEVLSTYTAKIMSGQVLRDNAGTNSNEKLLRQMAQTEVMNAWIDIQRLQTNGRLQVLEASKLALLQEEVLRDDANMLYRESVMER